MKTVTNGKLEEIIFKKSSKPKLLSNETETPLQKIHWNLLANNFF